MICYGASIAITLLDSVSHQKAFQWFLFLHKLSSFCCLQSRAWGCGSGSSCYQPIQVTSGSFHFLTQAGCPNIFLAAKSVSPPVEKANPAADHRGTELLLACPLPQALPPAFSPHYPLLAPLQVSCDLVLLSGNCRFPQLCPCCMSALYLLSALSLFSFSHFLSGAHCLFFLCALLQPPCSLCSTASYSPEHQDVLLFCLVALISSVTGTLAQG